MLEALLFDVDGTLAETEEAHRAAFNATFRAAGLDWVWDSALYRQLLQVAGARERIGHYIASHRPEFAARSDLEALVTTLHADKTRRFGEIVRSAGLGLRPGVARLLGQARSCGLRLAIATTTSLPNVAALLESAGGREAMGWFEVIGTGECASAKKPAPDIYYRVLQRLGLDATACLAVEDSAIGLHAALAADVTTLITPSEYSAGEDFAGACAVLSDLGEPGRPFRLLYGDAHNGDWVDVELLRRWHAAARAPRVPPER
ncbi:MAG: HAD family hydrolase [Gammaproteobacteria bacterium]|nr:MAG: HAD family hydrolase [Gammaproteobacteria bacterium]